MSLKQVLTLSLIICVVMGPCTFLSDATTDTIQPKNIALLSEQDKLVASARALSAIATSHPAFRVAGSIGANESAEWILSELSGLGLQSWKEEFSSQVWDLSSPASLLVDNDGDDATTDDIIQLTSFLPEMFSSPSNSNLSYPLERLYLPNVSSRDEWVRTTSVPTGYWNDLDLSNKIVLVPREIRWNPIFEARLANKIAEETPIGIVFFYAYSWNSVIPDMMQASSGGAPLSNSGKYLMDNEVAAGAVNYSDGVALMDIEAGGSATARLFLPSTISLGKQANVVAHIEGKTREEILITAHYDSVMSAAYVDNTCGVATLMEAARCMSDAQKQGWQPTYGIRFIAFAGEEMGCLGSAWYVSQHNQEISSVRAIINVDCISGENLVMSLPLTSEGSNLDSVMEQESKRFNMDIEMTTSEAGGSDHHAFIAPWEAIAYVNDMWGMSIPTQNLKSAKNAAFIHSYPLAANEVQNGRGGLIHTSYDDPMQEKFDYWINDTRYFEQSQVVISFIAVLASTTDHQTTIGALDIFPVAVLAVLAISLIIGVFLYRNKRRS